MDHFRNINYPYRTEDDVFIGRGLQLNVLVDEVNGIIDGLAEAISTDALTVTGIVTFSGLLIDNTEEYVVAVDNATGLLSKRSVASIAPVAVWTKTSTNLSPTTAGDDILLANTTEHIYFGDSDKAIYGQSGSIVVTTGGDQVWNWGSTNNHSFQNLLPGDNKTLNLGGIVSFWDNAYVDRLYIDDVNTYIDIAAGDMTFTDAVTGTKTLAELASTIPMVYPGAGIALSTGAAWGSSITNNSANWNTAYAHTSLTNNPHSVDATDVLPSQGGHAGEFLTTNGSVLSWAAGGGGGVTSVAAGNGMTFTTITTTGSVTLGTPTTLTSVTTNIVTTSSHSHAIITGIASGNIVKTSTTCVNGEYARFTSTGLESRTAGEVASAVNGSIVLDSCSGTLGVPKGGTGRTSLTNNYVLVGDGSSDVSITSSLQFNGSTFAVTGAITATGEITAYSSDERLKLNIFRISDPLEKVGRLNGVTYDWNADVCASAGFIPARKHETGMIAQNLGSVIPDAISFAPFDRDYDNKSKSGEDYLTVNLEKVIPLLVEAVKELTDRNEKLMERIEQLENN